jgi:hypothetical protein
VISNLPLVMANGISGSLTASILCVKIMNLRAEIKRR